MVRLLPISMTCLPYEPECCLRSAGTALLMVPWSCLITKGDRAFAVCAPQLWNSLCRDLSSWTKAEDELDSTHIMHVDFNSLSDYAESFWDNNFCGISVVGI